jgi:hypothetical protein
VQILVLDTVSAENTTNVLAMPIGKEMIVPNVPAHSPNHGVMLLTDTTQLTTMLNALLKELVIAKPENANALMVTKVMLADV